MVFKFLGKRREIEIVEPNRFIDLGQTEQESSAEDVVLWVKVAELRDSDDIPMISQQLYKGNMVIVDYSAVADEKETMMMLSSELKAVTRDCNGDMVSVGPLLVMTPNGVRVDRMRLRRL
ncbi:MAG: uncharacterized protein PWQ88_45 [Candidatus Methanomethylophilaceae archaeon]|nr:uncharacterized protein [Candidatus Methanomethylophilaceae archaeon]MDI3541814.1 uncharacterized protein [Candidatus Methanomethylophilaceae archaeon]